MRNETELQVSKITTIDTRFYNNKLVLTVEDLDLSFIGDLSSENIFANVNDLEKHFIDLVKFDEDILHNYLNEHCYIKI